MKQCFVRIVVVFFWLQQWELICLALFTNVILVKEILFPECEDQRELDLLPRNEQNADGNGSPSVIRDPFERSNDDNANSSHNLDEGFEGSQKMESEVFQKSNNSFDFGDQPNLLDYSFSEFLAQIEIGKQPSVTSQELWILRSDSTKSQSCISLIMNTFLSNKHLKNCQKEMWCYAQMMYLSSFFTALTECKRSLQLRQLVGNDFI